MGGVRYLVWKEGGELPQELVLLLQANEVAVIPTDTLYALAARAFSSEAVEKVYRIKGRERKKALSLFFARVEELESLFHLSPLAMRLAECYLPGPLTLVLKPRVEFPPPLLGPGGGVGVRVPQHPIPRMLVEALGEPVTATSANVSGERDPLTVADLPPRLLEEVKLVVDGGKARGVPSTVVDFTGDSPRILREGVISSRKLEEIFYG
ncbi:MAG: threonylcarbamoyl-AMP synthase [Aquificota bacterium]|nr:MAG: threonylcarbamoyl-AMP synthase [Aquificota bacterium]RLD97165.1 MAG: threonylcarbamoyl-AMP synthase [Aquificota bacterium]